MAHKLIKKSKRNYGILTDASKAINEALGDKTGRTVSMRTAHGFKNSFELNDSMDDETAEDIVHGGMVASALLLCSKNEGAKIGGLLLLLSLVACYQNGK
ncbi:MAG: hypothetical protein ACOZCO_02065 [Bacteroidota bacterium]